MLSCVVYGRYKLGRRSWLCFERGVLRSWVFLHRTEELKAKAYNTTWRFWGWSFKATRTVDAKGA